MNHTRTTKRTKQLEKDNKDNNKSRIQRKKPRLPKTSKHQEDNDSHDDDNTTVSLTQIGTSASLAPYSSWITRMAILGDSPMALCLSFGFFLTAVLVAWYLDHPWFWTTLSSSSSSVSSESESLEQSAYQRLGPILPPVGPAIVYTLDNPQYHHYHHHHQYNITTALADQITPDMKRAYHYDGVIALRGIIPPDLLHALQQATDPWVDQQQQINAAQQQQQFLVRGKQFFTVQHSAIFQFQSANHSTSSTSVNNVKPSSREWILDNPFVQLVLQTALPQVAATLMWHDDADDVSSPAHEKKNKNRPSKGEKSKNLRLLRDIFLAKDDDPYTCGWHTDDTGFWPATADSPGVNAWIALDDYNNTAAITEEDGTVVVVESPGGFALAVASHRASWRHEAYQVTGATPTFPPHGFTSAHDMIQRREGSGTCNIAQSAPHLQRRLEETKRVYQDLREGDVIFHDRFLFHRTIAQTRPSMNGSGGTAANRANTGTLETATSQDDTPVVKRRYSVRFGPGDAIIPPGYGTEPSVLYHPAHGGQTADTVSATWPWYPQVWPTALETELNAWGEFCQTIWPQAMALQAERKQELKPLLQRRAQKQQRHPQQGNHRQYDFSEGYQA